VDNVLTGDRFHSPYVAPSEAVSYEVCWPLGISNSGRHFKILRSLARRLFTPLFSLSTKKFGSTENSNLSSFKQAKNLSKSMPITHFNSD